QCHRAFGERVHQAVVNEAGWIDKGTRRGPGGRIFAHRITPRNALLAARSASMRGSPLRLAASTTIASALALSSCPSATISANPARTPEGDAVALAFGGSSYRADDPLDLALRALRTERLTLCWRWCRLGPEFGEYPVGHIGQHIGVRHVEA